MTIHHIESDLFQGFHPATALIAIGLLLTTVGSVLPIFPLFFTWHSLDDEEIVKVNRKNSTYIRRRHYKDRRVAVWSSGLLALGFLLGLIGLIMQIRASSS